MTEHKELTTKELTELVGALGSAVRAQQPVNQAMYNRLNNIEIWLTRVESSLNNIEKRLADLEYPKVTLIDEVTE